MSTIDSKVDAFVENFQKISLTLIAKLAEINESLDRISSDTELLAKIKIQLAENMKQSSAVEKHINALNSRLDKVGLGGLAISIASPSASGPSANSPKATPASANAEESIFSMPASPTISEKEGAMKDDLSDLGLIPAPIGKPNPSSSPKPSPLTPLPEMPKPKAGKLTVAESPAKLPEKPVPRAVPSTNFPFLQIKNPENPSFVIIQNLSKEVNELGSSEDIGKAFLRVKDALTAQIKFHPALFDLIKYGNDYIRKKPVVNDTFRAEVQKKVEELYKKFGGT